MLNTRELEIERRKVMATIIAFVVFLSACLFVCWLDKGKKDTQKDGVCDFSGQGRDEWKTK